jgi:TolA-binding protein
MTAHRDDSFDPEDLIARARCGMLSRTEHEALVRALAESPDLAALYRVGMEIDRASAVQGGDDALIARAADAALARVAEMTSRTRAQSVAPRLAEHERGGHARWAVAAAALLSVVLASGFAGALWSGVVEWPFESKASEPSEANADAKPEARARKRAKAPAAPQAEAVQPQEIQQIRVEDYAPSAPEPRARKIAAQDDSTQGAASLFSEANAARRSGDLARARRTYAQLIERHPSSDEAGLARVSLGKLLLASGDARGAEREFKRYLAAGGGQLAEEALVGQAQALGIMQRSNDERQAWQRLLATYPSSVYATQAKQRLSALALE